MRCESDRGVCGLVAALIIVAVAADWWMARQRPPDMDVPAEVGWMTVVGYPNNERTPPPWPGGNCFSLADEPQMHVVNMHAANFARIVRDLGLETVRVRRVGKSQCLVIDPRIPRSWLMTAPCTICTPPDLARDLAAAYPEWFRPRDAHEPAGAPDRGGKK